MINNGHEKIRSNYMKKGYTVPLPNTKIKVKVLKYKNDKNIL